MSKIGQQPQGGDFWKTPKLAGHQRRYGFRATVCCHSRKKERHHLSAFINGHLRQGQRVSLIGPAQKSSRGGHADSAAWPTGGPIPTKQATKSHFFFPGHRSRKREKLPGPKYEASRRQVRRNGVARRFPYPEMNVYPESGEGQPCLKVLPMRAVPEDASSRRVHWTIFRELMSPA